MGTKEKNEIPVVSIVGQSKTGKTTLIERLIPAFKEKGLDIAVIKHHHLDFEVDVPGKDTHRFKQAGAKTTIISSPVKLAMVTSVEKDIKPMEIIRQYIKDVDLIIIEGYKKERIPKIEVYRYKKGSSPICLKDGLLMAIVTDLPFDSHVPVFHMDEIEVIADFIVSKFINNSVPLAP
ncbi:MAG TPA: molybdopterin-guanine dinucleotide biosynthesis protein B [Syntrophorhabdaceae bacterium]|nr:molybdopterin-guanine dinucleotide biosynthesis protein B [Syntrophorhabdaceae bacterium]